MKKLIILTILLLTPKQALAQGLNLSISPPLLQATIKPGKSISQVFTIYNNNSTPIKLTPRIVPFLPEDDQGNPSLQTQLHPAWLSYFSLANSEIALGKPFTLLPNSSDQLVLSIKIPENTVPADHYATILVNSEQVSETRELGLNQSFVSGSIGANVLLTISNQAAPPTILNIIDLKPIDTRFIKIGQTYILDNFSPIRFSAKLENLGRHLTEAHGLFQIHKGTNVSHIQSLLPVNVLAQSTRELVASSSSQLQFTPRLTQVGRYKASINIRSENGSTQNSISLILLPIKAILGLLVAILLLKFTLKKSQ